MCTVTLVRSGDLLRVACNRDESRQRRPAHPPCITRAGSLVALMPLDPQGRGTWIASNSAGLVFVLLNAHGEDRSEDRGFAPSSRGLLIPALVDCETVEDVLARSPAIVIDGFKPFRLLVADLHGVVEFAADAGTLRPVLHDLSQPLLFCSSSLGDALVEGPRRVLFDQMFRGPGAVVAHQDAYHRHRWRDRPALSVHMSRPEACTVSITTVEVTSTDVRMLYEPSHCDAGVPAGLLINRFNVERPESHMLHLTALAS